MAERLERKVAIVTGAGSGIGRAMALLFAAEGATIVAADISGREAATAASIGGNSLAFNVDTSNEKQIEGLISAAVARFGRIDVVCNNAGYAGELVALHETSTDELDKIFSINLRGAFLVQQKAIVQMLANGGGSIVNTASIASFHSTRGHAAYSASKGGVMAMTRAAAVEYGDRNIRVNALCPGLIETPMVASAPDAVKAAMLTKVPMNRTGTADEMARVALFLASDHASYVNGIGLIADGGRSAG